MANLVIKPTTNNSLKIQDQGGTERISLNTSGELSLPTVTSGTITGATLGSGVTFPAGHILQAVNHKQGSGTSLGANSTDWKGIGFGKSITLSSASHKVLILVSINGYQGTQGQYYSFNLYRHTAAFTANGSVSGTQLFNNGRGFGTIYGNTGDRFANVSASLIDSPETTTEIYYNVCHKEEGGQGIYDGYNQDSTITLLEIAG